MAPYHIRIIGGWCGNRMVMIRDHLSEILTECGYQVKVTTQSVWETYALPPSASLILQLIPAFNESDTGCPIVNIKPYLRDLDHQGTLSEIISTLEDDYPQKTGLAAGKNPLKVIA
jgi:hypothetical protein